MPRKVTDYIVVHCAATKPSMNIGAKEIDRWHRQRGWLCIGYHYVIRRDGTLETGRPVDDAGAHVEGHNMHSVGVCLVGGISEKGKPECNYTEAQWKTLASLLKELTEKYPTAKVVGHSDLNPNKACPVFDVTGWYGEKTQFLDTVEQ